MRLPPIPTRISFEPLRRFPADSQMPFLLLVTSSMVGKSLVDLLGSYTSACLPSCGVRANY